MVREPKSYPFVLKFLDENDFKSWKRACFEKYKPFACELCGTPFEVGHELKCTYTNDQEGTVGGNPMTCGACAKLSYDMRRKIWRDINDTQLVSRLVINNLLQQGEVAPAAPVEMQCKYCGRIAGTHGRPDIYHKEDCPTRGCCLPDKTAFECGKIMSDWGNPAGICECECHTRPKTEIK